jgi:hypothetical protein
VPTRDPIYYFNTNVLVHQPDASNMEHSPEVGSSKKAPRRYAFACSNCRKKKIRCDGVQPECTSCVRAEEVCQYPKKRMEAQLAQAQKRIQQLESELRESKSNSPYGSQSASSPGALYSDSEQDYSLYSHVGFDARGSASTVVSLVVYGADVESR